MIELAVALVVAHLLADYPLQGDFLAGQKNNALRTSVGTHALTAHALIQGGIVGAACALLGYNWLGPFVLVAVTHWVIDLGKVRGRYGLTVDQLLHVIVLALVLLLVVG